MGKRKLPAQRRYERARTRKRDGETQRRVITRDPRAPERHAAWGRQPPSGRRVGEGAATEDAREEVHTRTLECARCGLLLDWKQCKRAAYARKPPQLRKGDGCLGKNCGKRAARPAMRDAGQRKYCRALERGERRLVAWPDSAEDTDVWERPVGARARIVERLRARYGYDTDDGEE